MDELTADDLTHLRRCVDLARQALDAGEEPFGSLLVDPDGVVLLEDHNRVAGGDRTRHPEFELARRATTLLTPDERAAATVYTSGEHCAMCAAAHAWAGLGRIVYASSTAQLATWNHEMGRPPGPVRPMPVWISSTPQALSAWMMRAPVRCSSKPSSGIACSSRRRATSSPRASTRRW